MALTDLMREVKNLSSDELEAQYIYVQEQREQRRMPVKRENWRG